MSGRGEKTPMCEKESASVVFAKSEGVNAKSIACAQSLSEEMGIASPLSIEKKCGMPCKRSARETENRLDSVSSIALGAGGSGNAMRRVSRMPKDGGSLVSRSMVLSNLLDRFQ